MKQRRSQDAPARQEAAIWTAGTIGQAGGRELRLLFHQLDDRHSFVSYAFVIPKSCRYQMGLFISMNLY